MNFRRHPPQGFIGFQIAPMVDVLLVLVCFFLVTWGLARWETDIEVKLPVAKKGSDDTSFRDLLIINIVKDGSLIVHRQTVAAPTLLERLRALAKLNPDQAVIVRGDEAVPYRHIVEVLDLCREAGVWNVAFATSKPE
jgi:biopolymer transport protein ExbD